MRITPTIATTSSGLSGLIGLRDLQWRRLRFAIAVAATGLVFALGLVMSGVSASFDNEIDRTVGSFAADAWLVRANSFGPFTGPATMSERRVRSAKRLPGVRAADAVAVLRATTTTPDRRNVNLLGVVPGGVGSPPGDSGRILASGRGAIVDASLGLEHGARLDLNGKSFRVAGLTHGRTFFAGIPTVTVSLRAAQEIGLDGEPLATAVVTRGRPKVIPRGFAVLSNADVRRDLARPIQQAKETIGFIRLLLWVVAGGIIGAIVYLSALERSRDFAALKAIGVSTRHLLAGLCLQAVVLSWLAALLAVALEEAIAPMIAMSVEIPALTFATLPIAAMLVGVSASCLALRRAVGVQPALAFGGAG
jgi:putative ABC transport system permease protein